MVGRAASLAALEDGMSTRAAIERGVAAAFLAFAAVVLVLVAHDAWLWGRVFHDSDARADVRPIGADSWQIDSTLPAGTMRSILGIDDDLQFRRTAMQAVALAAQGANAFNLDQRVLTETALARTVRTDANPVRASAAADYLGVLLYQDRLAPKQAINPYAKPNGQEQSPEQRATAEFVTAVQLDPGNAEAKANLEAMLQQVHPPSQQGNARPGNGEEVNNKGSGSHPPGHGY
jgi:hypothetical protein